MRGYGKDGKTQGRENLDRQTEKKEQGDNNECYILYSQSIKCVLFDVLCAVAYILRYVD